MLLVKDRQRSSRFRWQRELLLAMSFLLLARPVLSESQEVNAANSKTVVESPDFYDVAHQAGLLTPNVHGHPSRKKYILETTGNGVAIFDFNNDGWLDVFAAGLKMQNGPQGAKYTSLLYKNVTVDSSFSTNHWLKLKLEGSQYTLPNGGWSVMSNRSAIGARVVLHLADQDIMREIIGGKGHGNMEPLQLHFGMNSHILAQGMTIYWPSRDPETNQRKVTYIDGPIDANLSYTYVEDIGFVGLKGDINGDEVVNVQDVVISVNHALDVTVPEPAIFWAADMNYDNILNILDVVRILNVILS